MREDLNNKTLAVLREMGKAYGLKNVTVMRKNQLIEALLPYVEEKEAKTSENTAPASAYYSESQITVREDTPEKELPSHTARRSESCSSQNRPQESRSPESRYQDGKPQEYRSRENRHYENRSQEYRSQDGRPQENRYQDRRPQERTSSSNIRTIRRTPSAAPRVSSNPRTGELQDAQGQPRTNYFRAPQRTEARQDNFNPANYADIDSGEEAHGILEIVPDGYGFIRSSNFLPGENDVYVSASQIRRFNMKTGDFVSGSKRVKTAADKNAALLYVNQINNRPPSEAETRKAFEDLTPVFPNERLQLETPGGSLSTRIMNLISPIGKGQRGMIVSPPKAGKTTLLKQAAAALTKNHPELHLIVLLIDERPEEVTDIKESIEGPNTEVIYSTFDQLPDNHRRVSEMVLERAKRLVEHKRDVVILLDSITRLARAYNLTCTPSGRTLSGGLDPNALHMPKRFFGAARNMREGGSLTILATALVDTGSRMDDVVFEEFKGTGNMELVLDRKLSEKRIFPALDLQKSGTRRDDLLLSEAEQLTVSYIHKSIQSQRPEESIERILDKFKNTRCNKDLIEAVCRSKYI